MRVAAALLISLSLASSPAFASADSFNSINNANSANSMGYNDLGWVYGPDREERSAKAVLAKLRTLCSSDHHYDQYFCARGMKVLNKAYADYKLRLAAKNSVAE